MPVPNLPLLEEAAQKLAPFLEEIVFVGGAILGLLITDQAAAPIRGTNDVDVIAEIVTYADYKQSARSTASCCAVARRSKEVP